MDILIEKEKLEKHLWEYGTTRKGISFKEYGSKTHGLIKFKLILKKKNKKFKKIGTFLVR